MTFSEYADRWLSRQVKYAPSTLESYRRMLRVINFYIGGVKLNRLRPIALENMMIELRKQTCRGRQIQEATVQKYRRCCDRAAVGEPQLHRRERQRPRVCRRDGVKRRWTRTTPRR